MPRPSQIDEQRKKLLPIICRVFSEQGYRRTTTAELARRCEVRVNILYRLWPDKKAMFLATINDIFQHRAEKWGEILAGHAGPQQAIARLVAYEAQHQGEFGYYRVIFTALTETDDPDIRAALIGMYRRFHQLVRGQVVAGRERDSKRSGLSVDKAAWALLGLATVSNIIRELKLLAPGQRKAMFAAVAKFLASGQAS